MGRKLDLRQSAGNEQPAVIGNDPNTPPARPEQGGNAIRNAFHFRFDVPYQCRTQRMAHLVEPTDFRPAALVHLRG